MYKNLSKILLISLGITSFTWIPLPGSVKPLSFFIAIFVIVLGLKKLPKFTKVDLLVFLFIIYAILRQSYVLYEVWNIGGNVYFKSRSVEEDVITSLVSIIVFYVHYLSLKISLKVLGIHDFLRYAIYGVGLSCLFATMQFILSNIGLSSLGNSITKIVSDSAIEWSDRARGLAYEPSWLASQITVIMIPFLLYLKVRGNNIRNWNLWMVLSIVSLIITFSRGGILALIIIIIFYFATILNKKSMVSVFAFIAIGAISYPFASSVLLSNAYFRSTYSGIAEGLGQMNIREAFLKSNAGPRYAAWESALDTTVDKPIFGTGLGLQYREFARNPPRWSIILPEVRYWLSNYYPDRANPKNMILRISSELGIPALVLFIVCIYTSLRTSRYRQIAILMLPAIFIDFMSIDSFALITLPLFLAIGGKYESISYND